MSRKNVKNSGRPRRSNRASSSNQARKRYLEEARADGAAPTPSNRMAMVIIRPASGLPFPSKMRTTLTYSQTVVSANGSSGTLSNFQFVLNGCAAPIGGGHQPMGYDQLTAIYQFIRVIACRVRIIGNPGTGTANPPFFGVAFSENSSFSPANINVIIERGNASFAVCPSIAGYGKQIVVRRTWDAKSWYPIGFTQDQSACCAGNSNPTGELVYANVFVISPSGSVVYDDMYCNVTLEYDVECFGQLQTTQS